MTAPATPDPLAPPANVATPDPPPATPLVPLAVYAAALDPETRAWAVDIINFEAIDTGPLDRRLAALGDREDSPFIDRFAPGDAGLPVGFAHGDPWTLVTLAGAEQRIAAGFGASVPGGSAALHFKVDLGPAQPGAKGWAIALRGHAATTAKLVAPKPLAPAALAPGALGRIVEALVPKLDEDLRPHVRKTTIAEKHVKLFPGRFPGGRSHVAFVHAMAKSDEDDFEVSGVLFTRTDGAVEFFAVADVLGAATFFALVDIDGDGLDEVLYEDQYHEGWYLQMIHWNGGKPESRTLMGDGV
ncbi:hypothetical protein [Nannocystis bainbridge]|uniref:VCBS repeat-containing protein n=1 Tax=Nannocystis bainbridge TaxID=2995303 RepID=A0ABT5DUZ5_9BACT|nr:hypothetical protein [Nannocystis bainbridge]MDC0716236.1 hypothetical protein [Nannocystis bainbridge]